MHLSCEFQGYFSKRLFDGATFYSFWLILADSGQFRGFSGADFPLFDSFSIS
jgi:hypothetical protein